MHQTNRTDSCYNKEREDWETTSSLIQEQGTVAGGKEMLNCGKGRAGDNLGQ
jgi:hypothetical protein